MVDCKKRQREISGSDTSFRCIHHKSSVYAQIVTDDQCKGCPIRVSSKKKSAPCKEKLPTLIIKSQDGFPGCPFRYTNKSKEITCSITGLQVTAKICHKCEKESRTQEAKFGQKVKNYFGAIRRWVAHGKPTRSQMEINELFTKNCKNCERYDNEKHACKNCGCTISNGSDPLENKLAMATAHCPLGRF